MEVSLLIDEKMKKINLVFCLITIVFSNMANCQYNGDHWAFGDSAYINWSNPQLLMPVFKQFL